jgi:hypothetical protein
MENKSPRFKESDQKEKYKKISKLNFVDKIEPD